MKTPSICLKLLAIAWLYVHFPLAEATTDFELSQVLPDAADVVIRPRVQGTVLEISEDEQYILALNPEIRLPHHVVLLGRVPLRPAQLNFYRSAEREEFLFAQDRESLDCYFFLLPAEKALLKKNPEETQQAQQQWLFGLNDFFFALKGCPQLKNSETKTLLQENPAQWSDWKPGSPQPPILSAPPSTSATPPSLVDSPQVADTSSRFFLHHPSQKAKVIFRTIESDLTQNRLRNASTLLRSLLETKEKESSVLKTKNGHLVGTRYSALEFLKNNDTLRPTYQTLYGIASEALFQAIVNQPKRSSQIEELEKTLPLLYFTPSSQRATQQLASLYTEEGNFFAALRVVNDLNYYEGIELAPLKKHLEFLLKNSFQQNGKPFLNALDRHYRSPISATLDADREVLTFKEGEQLLGVFKAEDLAPLFLPRSNLSVFQTDPISVRNGFAITLALRNSNTNEMLVFLLHFSLDQQQRISLNWSTYAGSHSGGTFTGLLFDFANQIYFLNGSGGLLTFDPWVGEIRPTQSFSRAIHYESFTDYGSAGISDPTFYTRYLTPECKKSVAYFSPERMIFSPVDSLYVYSFNPFLRGEKEGKIQRIEKQKLGICTGEELWFALVEGQKPRTRHQVFQLPSLFFNHVETEIFSHQKGDTWKHHNSSLNSFLIQTYGVNSKTLRDNLYFTNDLSDVELVNLASLIVQFEFLYANTESLNSALQSYAAIIDRLIHDDVDLDSIQRIGPLMEQIKSFQSIAMETRNQMINAVLRSPYRLSLEVSLFILEFYQRHLFMYDAIVSIPGFSITQIENILAVQNNLADERPIILGELESLAQKIPPWDLPLLASYEAVKARILKLFDAIEKRELPTASRQLPTSLQIPIQSDLALQKLIQTQEPDRFFFFGDREKREFEARLRFFDGSENLQFFTPLQSLDGRHADFSLNHHGIFLQMNSVVGKFGAYPFSALLRVDSRTYVLRGTIEIEESGIPLLFADTHIKLEGLILEVNSADETNEGADGTPGDSSDTSGNTSGNKGSQEFLSESLDNKRIVGEFEFTSGIEPKLPIN